MSPNPSINLNKFLSLAEISILLPETLLEEDDLEFMEKGRLVITRIEDGILKIHLGSFIELLKLHIL